MYIVRRWMKVRCTQRGHWLWKHHIAGTPHEWTVENTTPCVSLWQHRLSDHSHQHSSTIGYDTLSLGTAHMHEVIWHSYDLQGSGFTDCTHHQHCGNSISLLSRLNQRENHDLTTTITRTYYHCTSLITTNNYSATSICVLSLSLLSSHSLSLSLLLVHSSLSKCMHIKMCITKS